MTRADVTLFLHAWSRKPCFIRVACPSSSNTNGVTYAKNCALNVSTAQPNSQQPNSPVAQQPSGPTTQDLLPAAEVEPSSQSPPNQTTLKEPNRSAKQYQRTQPTAQQCNNPAKPRTQPTAQQPAAQHHQLPGQPQQHKP